MLRIRAENEAFVRIAARNDSRWEKAFIEVADDSVT